MAITSTSQFGRGIAPRFNGLLTTTILAALCVALPILVVISFITIGVSDAWDHLLETLLGRYALNSLLLSVLVALRV